MKKLNIVLFIIFIGVAVAFTATLIQTKKKSSILAPSQSRWPEKINTEADVEVRVKPVDLESEVWTFEVIMNTHGGSLDTDVVKTSVLKTDTGGPYKPLAWDGSPPGGHHRSGILKFQAPKGNPEIISLTIGDVGEIEKRIFSWNLK